jgi:hypothetical protein
MSEQRTSDLVAQLRDLENLPHKVTKIAAEDLFGAAADKIENLERLLRGGIQLVESLRVFGNDNVHRYDVPPWLDKARAAVKENT